MTLLESAAYLERRGSPGLGRSVRFGYDEVRGKVVPDGEVSGAERRDRKGTSQRAGSRGPWRMIATEGLTKRYGATTALANLSMTIHPGEVFGLLGPNGSGKTTTIRLLLGLLRPTSGRASVAGFDCWRQSLEVRNLVSYLPGELRMYGAMSGLGMLRFLSDLRGGVALDRAVAIAERVMGLDLRRQVRTYSTGMKQKLRWRRRSPTRSRS